MTTPVVEALTDAFIAERTETVFGVLGNRNMYWLYAMQHRGARVVQPRHEHTAVAMADGYARAAGEVGVASVTSGPGLAHTAAALAAAAERGTPVVLYAGDLPLRSRYGIQAFDHAAFAAAVGAGFVPVRHPPDAARDVQEAFYQARTQRRPVLLSVPSDVLSATADGGDVTPSWTLVPPPQAVVPDPHLVGEAARLLADARRPLVVIGRGACAPDAIRAVAALVDRLGALVGTSLPASGALADHPRHIGILGGLMSERARTLAAAADLVVAVGARFGHYTSDGGTVAPEATVIAIDEQPGGSLEGQQRPRLAIVADAAAGVDALVDALVESPVDSSRDRPADRDDPWADAVQSTGPDRSRAEPESPGSIPGQLTTAAFMAALDEALDPDVNVVIGLGHFMHHAVRGLSRRLHDRGVLTHDFGCIGRALPVGLGVALASPGRSTVVVEGDGSIMQHVQELETARRESVRLLVIVVNDGGYGAEFHKLRATGLDDRFARYEPVDLAAVARAFGCQGHTVTDLSRLPALLADHAAGQAPVVWDVRVESGQLAPTYRPTALASPLRHLAAKA